MKKVWIASILTTLMLTVPLTSVVSANEVEDCLECQPVNRVDLLKVKLLLTRLEVIINGIISKFKDIPYIQEKFQDISDRIKTFKEMNKELELSSSLWRFPIICTILEPIFHPLTFLHFDLTMLWEDLSETNPPLANLLLIILIPLTYFVGFMFVIMVLFGCDY